MEFAEQIMADLINQGYSGNELHEHFTMKHNLRKVCHAKSN